MRVRDVGAWVLAMLVGILASATVRGSGDEASEVPGWPTPDELRRDLQDIGWRWGAQGMDWTGTPLWPRPDPRTAVRLSGPPGELRVSFVIEAEEVDERFPRSLSSDWTAFREIATRLPVDLATQVAVYEQVSAAPTGCRDHPVPGGVVTVRSDPTSSDSFEVSIAQGSPGECRGIRPPETPKPTLAAPGLSTEAIVIEAREFSYSPALIAATAGRETPITLVNRGIVEHDLTIDVLGFHLEAVVGDTSSGVIPGAGPGTYDFYCSVPGHRQNGEVGRLVVTPSASPNGGSPEPTPEPTPRPTAPPHPPPPPAPVTRTEPSPSPSVESVLVGNYECLDLGTVRQQIEDVGLLLDTVTPEGPAPNDSWLVADQLPPAGEAVPPGSAVDLFVIDPGQPCPPA